MSSVVMLTAPWCSVCKSVKKSLGDFPLDVLDLDRDAEAAYRFHDVTALPTFILVTDDGQEIARLTGPATRQQLTHLVQSCAEV
jgi:thioredoxin-like negative regulator of GroEL